MSSSTRRGARADEVLPFFRGEGWIEGSWRKEDVAATIASFGSRAIWDPRFDRSKSQIVELLSDSDMLLYMRIRGSFVSDREACMVTTLATDDREGKENVLYVAACSVDDPLVPVSQSFTLPLFATLFIAYGLLLSAVDHCFEDERTSEWLRYSFSTSSTSFRTSSASSSEHYGYCPHRSSSDSAVSS